MIMMIAKVLSEGEEDGGEDGDCCISVYARSIGSARY